MREEIINNVLYVTSYALNYYNAKRTHGYSFTCDENGNVDESKMNEAALANYHKCKAGLFPDLPEVYVEKREQSFRLCPCGSGEIPHDLYDARGIYCGKVCDKCEKKERRKYRSEIFSNPRYAANEPIDEDDY